MPKGDLAYSFFEELYLKSGDLHEIEDGIFIGSAKAVHDYKVLAQHRISHILIVHGGLEPKFPGKFRYKKLNVPDLPYYELRECLPEAFEFFEDAFSKGRPHILVHCQKGISRSTSVALAWTPINVPSLRICALNGLRLSALRCTCLKPITVSARISDRPSAAASRCASSTLMSNWVRSNSVMAKHRAVWQ